MQGRYGPREAYRTIGKFKPEDVLNFIPPDRRRVEKTYKVHRKGTFQVGMGSDRYYCFAKSMRCACCGLEGKFFLLEQHRNRKRRPHFNLYAEEGKDLVMMTKDHIIPKGRGGEDERTNLQTMCAICNSLKGSDDIDMDTLFKRRQRYNLMKIISIRCLRKSKFLALWEIHFSHKGKKMRWELASRIKDVDVLQRQLYAGKEQPDAVIICATLGKKIVITREFRTPLGGYEYGFPAGLVDEGETVITAAARELKEETGLHAAKIVFGSPTLFSSAGMTDEGVQIVGVKATGKVDTSGAEDDEDIEVILMTRNEAAKLLRAEGRYETAMIGAKAWPLIYHFVVTGELFHSLKYPYKKG